MCSSVQCDIELRCRIASTRRARDRLIASKMRSSACRHASRHRLSDCRMMPRCSASSLRGGAARIAGSSVAAVAHSSFASAIRWRSNRSSSAGVGTTTERADSACVRRIDHAELLLLDLQDAFLDGRIVEQEHLLDQAVELADRGALAAGGAEMRDDVPLRPPEQAGEMRMPDRLIGGQEPNDFALCLHRIAPRDSPDFHGQARLPARRTQNL